MIETLKIATTLAEADRNVASAIGILKELNITNIIYQPDADLHQFINVIRDNELSVAGIEIGEFDYSYYKDLALTLNPKFMIYNWDGEDFGDRFLDEYVDCSINGNFIPMICLKHIKRMLKPRDKKLDCIFNKSKRLHLCLDPVEIAIRYNIDPVGEYFNQFYNKIGAVVVRDYLTGVGGKPVGYGSIKWDKICRSFDKYNGWLLFKPSLGERYNNLCTRKDVFKAAFAAFVEKTEACQ